MVYLNNIIIYSNNKEEYKEYIKQVLKRLHKENIPVTIKKYKFYIKKTNFIRFIIKPKQISIDPKKGLSYYGLARSRERNRSKVIFRIL